MSDSNLLFHMLRRSHGILVNDFEEPLHGYGGNSILRVSTDRGPLVVKVYGRNVYPGSVLRSLQNMLVAESHGISVPQIMRTKVGSLYSSVLDQLYVVESYIDGKPPPSLSDRKIVLALAKLHNISASKQRFHFRHQEVADWRRVVPKDFFYVLDWRFALISAAADRGLIADQQEYFEFGLIHGDLSRVNIILSNEAASFIDWDLSRLFYTGYEKFKILADCLLNTARSTDRISTDSCGSFDVCSYWKHFKIYLSVQLNDFKVFKQSFRAYSNSAEFEINKLVRLEKLIALYDSLGRN